jgi:hypothetical protein
MHPFSQGTFLKVLGVNFRTLLAIVVDGEQKTPHSRL